MHDDTDKSGAAPATGLIAGVAAMARNGFGLLLSRLELAALELSEALRHLLNLSLVFALALMAAWFAIAFGTVLVVYLAWESLGWTILPIMMLLFAGLFAALMFQARSMARHNNLALTATRAELQADRDMLKAMGGRNG